MRMALLTISLLVSTFSYSQSQQGVLGAWSGFSDPEIMSSGFNHKWSDLPLEGSVLDGSKYWSGPYWASKKGGINIRWNTTSQEGFDYKSPSKEQVKKMSLDQLSKLSATEKYDLLLNDYSYPLRTEAEGSSKKSASDWAGICHGWAPAALHHSEPTPKILTNAEGLEIPFGSGDIKALLSYYYAFYFEAETTNQIGLRCFFGGWLGGARACTDDLNAGAFHIIIANKFGIQKQGFLVDIDRYKEVWNQPAVGFKSKVLNANLAPSNGSASETVKEMRISTEFFYTDEADARWEGVQGTKYQKISKLDLVYRVELNSAGKIIGGDWESSDRPDFLWDKPKAPGFEGLLSRLPELLND